MAKKIAVLVRDRQEEALRMGLGLTLANDEVNVFVLDMKIEQNEKNDLNLEMMTDLEVKLFTNCRDNADMEFLTTEEIAAKLLEYDHILPY